jgi:glutathione S-transferase
VIRLHHLRYSRSTRILWLLEELGAPYELVQHHRDKSGRSPESLRAIHPLAKAPTMEVDGHVMVESGAIIEFLIERHGASLLAPPPGHKERSRYLEWLHFAEGSYAVPAVFTAFRTFMGTSPGITAFIDGEGTKQADFLEQRLSGREWLLDYGFTGADINLAFVADIAELAGMLDGRRHTLSWLDRCRARPAYQRAIEIGGPTHMPILQGRQD